MRIGNNRRLRHSRPSSLPTKTREENSQLKKMVSPMVALVICAGWKTAEVLVVVLPPTVTTICFADAAENAESCSWVRVSSVVRHNTSAGKTYGEHGGEHRAHPEQPAVERERGRGRRRGREGRGGARG